MNFMEAFMSSNFFLLLAIAIDGFYAELDLWMRCRFLATLKKQFWHCGHAHLFFWYSFLQTGTSRLRIDLTSVICIGPWSFIKGQKLMLYRWNLPLSFLWHFWQFYAQYLTMVMLGTLKRSQSKPTPVQSYSNSKEGYPDNDRRSCFISHLLVSF